MLAFLIALILAAGIFEYITLNTRASALRYEAHATRLSVEPGERFEIVSTIENASRLPRSYVRIQEKLPQDMLVDADALPRGYKLIEPNSMSNAPLRLISSVYLMPRQKLTRRITVSLPARGRYFLRGADITGGDFLGVNETTHSYSTYSEIVCIPRRAENACELSAFGGFLGDMSVLRFIMEDPVLTLGFREYTGREPQKQISWLVSARMGKLMVKEFDHTLESSATVLLNVAPKCEVSPALTERCFSLARTICEMLEDKRIKYSFQTNAAAAGAIGLWSTVAEGLGASHIATILEGLGRATYEPMETFARTVERVIASAELGRSHILITPYRDEEARLYAALIEKRTGGQVLLVAASEVSEEKEAL